MAGLVEPGSWAGTELRPTHSRDGEVDGDVDAGAEDQAKAGRRVDVGLGQQRGRRVVDNGCQLGVQALLAAGRFDDLAQVLAHETVGGPEALTHGLQ